MVAGGSGRPRIAFAGVRRAADTWLAGRRERARALASHARRPHEETVMDDTRRQTGDDRMSELPDHESDADVATEGSGILSHGDSAIDRGTGSVSGVAQGRDPSEGSDIDDDDDGSVARGVGDDAIEEMAAYDAGNRGSIPRGQTGALPEAGFLTDDPDRTTDEERGAR
jgi:hypothetical protein